MQYTDLQRLSATEFKRLCGVSRGTFADMIEVLRPHLERQGRRSGQNKLSVEDQLLVALFVLAGVPPSVSHRYERFRGELFLPKLSHKLGIARDNCWEAAQKGGGSASFV